MMAGHPGDVGLRNLVNTPFSIWVGALDSAYDRNKEVKKRGDEMDSLSTTVPGKYIHQTNIVAGKGHWMDQADTVAISWMNRFTRDPHPKQIIWTQEECLRNAFYWVSLPSSVNPVRGNTFEAKIDGNTITIDKMDYDEITIWLDDDMLDLSQPVSIQYNNRTLFKQNVERTKASMEQSIYERKDPSFCFPANVTVSKYGNAAIKDVDNSLLWSDDIQRIEVYDLLGRSIFTTTQRDEYLQFAEKLNQFHVVKIYTGTICKVETRK